MLATPPTWALALTLWLHMLATVAWLGGLAAIAILVLPAASRTLAPPDQLELIEAIQSRLEPLAWFSLALLVVTGLFQLSVNPHYDGFLATTGGWSLAILTKHILVVIMIVASAVQTWEVLPAIRRGLLRREQGSLKTPELQRLQRNEAWLLRLNIALSVLILAATAFARAS
jgi:uncharacterized membrane protein